MRGSQSRRAAGQGGSDVSDARALEPDELRRRTRDELRAVARALGLTGVSSLKKDALLARVIEAARGRVAAVPAPPALERSAPVAVAPPPPAAEPPPAPPAPGEERGAAPSRGAEDEPAAIAKLDLGPLAAAAERPPDTIPWSYGQDRVTAAAIDPARLFVYWEVTDPAIARAREALGADGAEAWLNLRVHDTTGRIFDGANAHSWFDHGVGRDDRQWFFRIGKPSSSAHVELGLKSPAGQFARIARSGRVDFPRDAPAPEEAPEWLTVRVATGETYSAGRGGRAGPPPHPAGPANTIPVVELGPGREGQDVEARVWQLLRGEARRAEWEQLLAGAGWLRVEGPVEWEGPVQVTRWEAGPFAYPVTVESPSREAWEGQSVAFRVGGVTHVVYGPWQVVIRNLGAFAERTELARWELFRSWVSSAGREVAAVPPVEGRPPGASEALAGASERRWIAGSELRLGGASEVFRLGASELRMRGASERLFAGASEWVARGASERRLGGASEARLRGGSEQRLGGGSEGRLGGGSEARLGASEGRLAPDAGPSAPLPYPKAEG